uniref:Uncharacterized protein n=1 Tax=Anguilla anguilla TaxID=7936 RepID=A0A0E9SMG9_ANGAN
MRIFLMYTASILSVQSIHYAVLVTRPIFQYMMKQNKSTEKDSSLSMVFHFILQHVVFGSERCYSMCNEGYIRMIFGGVSNDLLALQWQV